MKYETISRSLYDFFIEDGIKVESFKMVVRSLELEAAGCVIPQEKKVLRRVVKRLKHALEQTDLRLYRKGIAIRKAEKL